jgi:hypothetical protein
MGWKKEALFFLFIAFLGGGFRADQALGQTATPSPTVTSTIITSVFLNQSSPSTVVTGGQAVIYNLAYGNTGVPVTTMDTFETDTAGEMPAGWTTYGGSLGYVIAETVINVLNGPTSAGSQAVSAVYNNGCGPLCGRLVYNGTGPVTDGSIQADFYFPNSGNAAALMWRNSNDTVDNQYQMTISQGTSNNINLVVQYAGGTGGFQTLNTSSATINAGVWSTVKLAVSGVSPAVLTAYVNGVQVATASTTVQLAPGLPGIQVQGDSMVVFDNVQVIQSPDFDSVNLLDTLPTGLSYVTATGSPLVTGQIVNWNLGSLVAGSAATVQVAATANRCETTFINSAQLDLGAPPGSVSSNPVTTLAVCSPTPTPPAPGNQPYVYSNPSSGPTVSFVYNMAESGKANIRVWNASGVLAASLEDTKPAGVQQSVLNIQAFAPGHYFYQIDLKYDSGREDRSKAAVLAVQK